MKKFGFLLLVLFTFPLSICFAQDDANQEAPATRPTIFETLTDNSNSKKGVVVINQDERIKDMIYKKKEVAAKNNKSYNTQPGYRVQIYSSNEQRTAKPNAYKAEEKIKEKFPDMPVYVAYYSPFWKVRVGDCINTTEAQVLRDQVKTEFPEFSQETYIVKDQILVPED